MALRSVTSIRRGVAHGHRPSMSLFGGLSLDCLSTGEVSALPPPSSGRPLFRAVLTSFFPRNRQCRIKDFASPASAQSFLPPPLLPRPGAPVSRSQLPWSFRRKENTLVPAGFPPPPRRPPLRDRPLRPFACFCAEIRICPLRSISPCLSVTVFRPRLHLGLSGSSPFLQLQYPNSPSCAPTCSFLPRALFSSPPQRADLF